MVAWIFVILQLAFAFFFFFLVLSFYTGAPFVPSQSKSAKRMMELAHITKGTRVIDLGSGDGKLLFLAASHGAMAKGFEINPFLVLFTNIKALLSPYRTQVRAVWKNLWSAHLSDADVILLYLIPWKMDKLERKILAEAKPGTKIISNSFIFSHIPCTTKDEDNHVYGFTVPKKRV
jgi:ribosomal protein L11 methylase PrmA